jgi:hypothetical protein
MHLQIDKIFVAPTSDKKGARIKNFSNDIFPQKRVKIDEYKD